MELTSNKKNFFNIIERLVNFNKISHAYLIEVYNFDEDLIYILNFVKLILCSNKNMSVDNLNCNCCNICNSIDNGNYLDLKIIEPDGNFIKKKQLLELQEEFNNKSLLANKRIYIIKEAEKLNSSSANTILKFLEEPEDDIIAILLTTNRFQIIDTILSRCQVLTFRDDFVLNSIDDNIMSILKYIINGESLFINYKLLVSEILIDKNSAKDCLLILEHIFIDYLNYLSNPSNSNCSNDVIKLLKNVDSILIADYISIIEEEIKKLDYNVNYKLWLDCLFAKLIGG